VQQIIENLRHPDSEAAKLLSSQDLVAAEAARKESYAAKIEGIERAAAAFPDGTFGTAHLSKTLRSVCPEDTIWAVEAVTNTGFIHSNVRPTRPGSWINCGGGGLGWSGGGALGIKLAADAEGSKQFVCQIVGDGTYLFSIPGSVYWISKRYKIPVLTIVLNNNGESRLGVSTLALDIGSCFRLFVCLITDRWLTPTRLERTAQVVQPGAPRRRGVQGLQRGHKHLVRPTAGLRRHRGGCWIRRGPRAEGRDG